MSPELKPLPRGEAGRQLPVILQAQEVRGRPDFRPVVVNSSSGIDSGPKSEKRPLVRSTTRLSSGTIALTRLVI